MNRVNFKKSLLDLSIAMVLAGSSLSAFAGNSATGIGAFVAGGDNNTASGDFSAATAGQKNTANGKESTISGGSDNTTCSDSGGAVIGGGWSNTACDFSTIGGGWSNTADGISTIGGGQENTAGSTYSTVAGGLRNTAEGMASAVGGGWGNHAAGVDSTVPGGYGNYAGGGDSFAAGYKAHVRDRSETRTLEGDQGTFIWSDYSSEKEIFTSSGSNQFLVRAHGGFALNGTPIHPDVEMTVVASKPESNYANLFMRQIGTNAGILLSVGDATASNNAGFYIAQYNGVGNETNIKRLEVLPSGKVQVDSGLIVKGGLTVDGKPVTALLADLQAQYAAQSQELADLRSQMAALVAASAKAK